MKLYSFQEEGIAFLNSRKYALLADEMGLGKTIQAIYASINEEDKGVIIVCPPYLVGNWKKELSRIEHGRKLFVFNPSNTFYSNFGVEFKLPDKDEIYLLGYTQLPRAVDGKYKLPQFDFEVEKKQVVIIADEAQQLKNSKSSRTRSFRALISSACKSSYSKIWLLSGTPIMNKPSDLWALFQAMNYRGKKVFESWENFLTLFDARKEEDNYGYERIVWGRPKTELSDLLKPYYLHRTKRQVLPELPTKTISRYYVRTKSFLNEEDFSKIVELGNSPKIGNIFNKAEALSYCKYLETLDLIEEYENNLVPLVVFSNYVRSIQELGGKPGWGAVWGAAPMAKRQETIDDFQNGKINCLAGTIDCLGTGHTLTRASNAIFIDLDFTPANNWQAEDRLLRIGQKNAVNIIQVVSNDTVDKRINKLINDKISIIEGFNRVFDDETREE